MIHRSHDDGNRTEDDGGNGTERRSLDLSRRTYCKAIAMAAFAGGLSGTAAADVDRSEWVNDLFSTDDATHTATSDGSWSDDAVWEVGSPPGDESAWEFEPDDSAEWVDVHFGESGTDNWVGYQMEADGDVFVHTRDASGDGSEIDVRFVWDDGAGGQYVGDRRTHTY